MTTATQAPALESPEEYTDSTAEARAVSYILNTLSGSDLDHLILILKARREGLKVLMTYEIAMDAYERAPLSESAKLSPFKDSIRVKVATRRLIERGHFHPDQIRDVMLVIAFSVAPHALIARAAVAKGIEDGLAFLKDRAANGE